MNRIHKHLEIGYLLRILCFSAFAATSVAHATDYYFSPTGNDSNAGTSASLPWKSISKVSSLNLVAGDRILLEAGQTFTGSLYFGTATYGTLAESGTTTSPIVITNYNGSAKAKIIADAAHQGSAIYGIRTGGYKISNLILEGKGINSVSPATEVDGGYCQQNKLDGTGKITRKGLTFTAHYCSGGIQFINPNSNSLVANPIEISNVESYGFVTGIYIAGTNSESGFAGIRITNSDLHDNINAGLMISSNAGRPNKNVYLALNKFHDSYGDKIQTTGFGALLQGIDGLVVEKNLAYNNGVNIKTGAVGGNGGVGIMTSNVVNVLFQYNEAYKNRSMGIDGDGLDFDWNTSNGVMQYNYVHDNDGSGIILCNIRDNAINKEVNENITIRYNLSENDGRRDDHAGIRIWGRVKNSDFYNNTIYMDGAVNMNPYRNASAIGSTGIYIHNRGTTPDQCSVNLNFRNNIISTRSGNIHALITSGELACGGPFVFEGNVYDGGSTGPKFRLGGTDYSSVLAWDTDLRARSHFAGSVGSGYAAAADLSNPGHVGELGLSADVSPIVTKIKSITAYIPTASSVAIDRGVDLVAKGTPLTPTNLVIPSSLGSIGSPKDLCGQAIGSTVKMDIGACMLASAMPASIDVSSLSVIQANTGVVVATINKGGSYTFDPTKNLTIVANIYATGTQQRPQTMKFATDDGAAAHVEYSAPYGIAGDSCSGLSTPCTAFIPWKPASGKTIHLGVTPFVGTSPGLTFNATITVK